MDEDVRLNLNHAESSRFFFRHLVKTLPSSGLDIRLFLVSSLLPVLCPHVGAHAVVCPLQPQENNSG